MAWNTLTDQMVLDHLSLAEKAALDNLLANPQTLSRIIADETNAARGAIKAGGSQLDVAGTVPDQAKPHVVAIVIWRYVSSPSANEKLQTKARKDLFDTGMAFFDKVSRGEIKIELPATPDQTAGPVNAVQVASKEHRQWKRHKTRGF